MVPPHTTAKLFSADDEDGEQCSGFLVDPSDGQRRCAAGRPAGLFLPHEGKSVRKPQRGECWCIVEGVSDAGGAPSLGFLSAGLPTCQMAAKFASLFEGVHVIIIRDCDSAEIRAAQKTAERLDFRRWCVPHLVFRKSRTFVAGSNASSLLGVGVSRSPISSASPLTRARVYRRLPGVSRKE